MRIFSGVSGAHKADFRRLCAYGTDQAPRADNGDGSFDIVGKRSQTELASDFVQPMHQERTPVHPLLNRSKWMLYAFISLVKDIGTAAQPFRHVIKHSFVPQVF
jgi:hypothetical protein